MLDEIFQSLKEVCPADMHQIKKYVAWVSFKRKRHNEFYMPAHWMYGKTPEGRIVEAVTDAPLKQLTYKQDVHWLGGNHGR